MITTIIFDLSEVYLNGLLGVEKYLEETLGIPISNADLFVPELEQLFHGEITEEAYWQALIAKHSWSLSVADLKVAVRNNFREIKGTREIIESLKKNGYRLGLLSIHAKEWIVHCEKEFDYHRLFDSFMYSFEVAICKPEKKAFELMLQKLDVTPEECLFIDDSPKNTASAKDMGITVLDFTTPEQLKNDLIQLNIRL
jgi:FMN phosphatase YigB (HAD superfamily)